MAALVVAEVGIVPPREQFLEVVQQDREKMVE
jgi:hypothetical protein